MKVNEPAAREKEGLKALQRDFADFVRPFDAVRRIDAKALDKLDQAIKELPAGDTVAQAAEDLRRRAEEYFRRISQARRAAFGGIEAEFISRQRQSATATRETSEGWRVGMLELHVQREQARARALYNHEEVIGWNFIATVEDFEKLVERAGAELERAAIPQRALVEVFWAAYRELRAQRRQPRKKDSEAVLLLDFYREVRVALLRRELQSGRPDKKLLSVNLPKWAFLYNLDSYRSQAAAIPADRRLGLQTGSQAEQAKGLAMTTNGLDATQDYKAYCYVVPATSNLL